MKHKKQWLLTTAAIASLYGSVASAQQAVLEEVTVTARKIAESLQDTPLAVSAFTSQALEQQNISSVDDVTLYTPNVSMMQGYSGGSDGFYFIRGIGVNDFTAALDPPVGMYIDGVYMGRTAGSTFDLVDVERIEVLRGPQGTLFGRNTAGGAISVTSKRPEETFGGRATVQVGERDLYGASATLNVPLIEDVLLSRVSVLKREQDGWVDRLFGGGTLGDEDTLAGRLALEWRAMDNLTALLSVDHTDSDNTPQPQITTGADTSKASPCPPFCIPIPADINNFVSPDFYETWAGAEPINDTETFGTSLIVDWDLEAFAVKSISAYREIDQFSTADYDVSPYVFYDDEIPLTQEQYSQEFQFSGTANDGRITWLAGVFWYKEQVDQTNAITLGATGPGGVTGFFPPFPPNAFVVDPPLPGDDRFRIVNSQRITPETESRAVFGQTTIDITDKLSATLGLRWSRDEKDQGYDFNITNTIPNHPIFPQGTVPGLPPGTSVDKSWETWDPRVGLDYQITPSSMIYFSYAEGFRAGGFNSRPVQPPIDSFDPEEVATFEVGMKSEWFERRLRLNAAVFYSDYEEMQIAVLDGGFFNITNAGDATIQGFEVELTALPTPNLDLNMGLGYLDGEYDEVTQNAINAGVLKNNELPMMPEITFNAGARYTWQLDEMGEVSARIDYAYEDERYSYANNAPGNLLDSYSVVNLRFDWRSADQAWKASLIGLNVGDEEYLRFAEDVRQTASPLGTISLVPSPPSTWSAEVTYYF